MVAPLKETAGYTPGTQEALSPENSVRNPAVEEVQVQPQAGPRASTTSGSDVQQVQSVETTRDINAPATPAPDTPQMPDLSFLSNIGGFLSDLLGGAPEPASMEQNVPEDIPVQNAPLRGTLPANTSVDTSGWELRGSQGDVSMEGRKYVPVIDKLTAPPPAKAEYRGGYSGKELTVTQRDVYDLAKTVYTEWVVGQGTDQGKGIIDTVLNRVASGAWGKTLAEVVSAPSQFSAVNGPIKWDGKNRARGIADIPDTILQSGKGAAVLKFVEQYLGERAGGAESIVGDHLNYANRAHSTPNNYGWIDKLDGPKFGGHKHGTTEDKQRLRPGKFGIKIEGSTPRPKADVPVPPIYSKIPDMDDKGNAGQLAKFREWNPDPVKNEEKNLGQVQPALAQVFRRAKLIAQADGQNLVVGSGRRTPEQQAKAVEWGWSKDSDSDHLPGDSLDVWVIDQDGAVSFDKEKLASMRNYMRAAAKELGVSLKADINWDLPHFSLG